MSTAKKKTVKPAAAAIDQKTVTAPSKAAPKAATKPAAKAAAKPVTKTAEVAVKAEKTSKPAPKAPAKPAAKPAAAPKAAAKPVEKPAAKAPAKAATKPAAAPQAAAKPVKATQAATKPAAKASKVVKAAVAAPVAAPVAVVAAPAAPAKAVKAVKASKPAAPAKAAKAAPAVAKKAAAPAKKEKAVASVAAEVVAVAAPAATPAAKGKTKAAGKTKASLAIISNPELLDDGSDEQLQILLHKQLSLASVNESIRAGYAAQVGLTSIEFTFLTTIQRLEATEDVSIKMLAQHLRLSGPFATATVSKLMQNGLVSKKVDPSDRRRVCLRIDTAGHQLMAQLRPIQRQVNDVRFASLNRKDFQQFSTLLSKLLDTSEQALALQSYLGVRS